VAGAYQWRAQAQDAPGGLRAPVVLAAMAVQQCSAGGGSRSSCQDPCVVQVAARAEAAAELQFEDVQARLARAGGQGPAAASQQLYRPAAFGQAATEFQSVSGFADPLARAVGLDDKRTVAQRSTLQ
jgi:hypothetical protein